MAVEQKRLEFIAELKAVGDDASGEFEGYGSIFGNVNSYGDIVAKGAFAESIKQKMPALLWQHNPSSPIGVYTDIREDNKGLYVKGKLNLDVQQGKEAYSLLKQGALKGMSIGFMTLVDEMDQETGIRTIKKIDLWEVSLVTFPANDKASVTSVKSAHGTVREFEKFLRDAGYNADDAKLVASKGFNALTTHREGGDLALVEQALKGALSAVNAIRKSPHNGTGTTR